MTTEGVLREFMRDIEAVGIRHVREEWPDLAITYRHARKVFGLPVEDPEADDDIDFEYQHLNPQSYINDDNNWK